MHLCSIACGQMAGGLCVVTYVAQPAAHDPHPIIYLAIWKTQALGRLTGFLESVVT